MMFEKLVSKLYESLCSIRDEAFLLSLGGPAIGRAIMRLNCFPWATNDTKKLWMHNVVDGAHRVHKHGLIFKRYPRTWWIYRKLVTSVDISKMHAEFAKYHIPHPDRYRSIDMRALESRTSTLIMDLYFKWAAEELSKKGQIKYTDAFDKLESLLQTYRYATKSTIIRRRIINGHEIKIN